MNELEEKLKPLLEEFIEDALKEIGQEAKEYASDMTKEFAKYLYANLMTGDDIAARNLEMLKSTALNLAVKYQIRAGRAAMEQFEKALSIVAKIALTALKVTVA